MEFTMAVNTADLRQKIDQALQPYRPLKWGVCDLDPALPLPQHYEKVVVIVMPLPRVLTLAEYAEPVFKHMQFVGITKLQSATRAVSSLLDAAGIRYGYAPHSADAETFERNMTEAMNNKEAARLAGLGWIGKSNLLVTEEYGPQVNIATILCDAPLSADTPVTTSNCGSCENCVKNCPFDAIHGKAWTPGLDRLEQVDYVKCSTCRLKTYEHLGRKITCAKCVFACPFGWKRPV